MKQSEEARDYLQQEAVCNEGLLEAFYAHIHLKDSRKNSGSSGIYWVSNRKTSQYSMFRIKVTGYAATVSLNKKQRKLVSLYGELDKRSYFNIHIMLNNGT